MSVTAKVFSKNIMNQKRVEKLVNEFLPSIQIMAKQVLRRYPSSLDYDDLVSCGVCGLLQARKKFNPKKNILFKTFAEYRIRGAMLDEIRSFDWASRYYRDQIKKARKIKNKMIQEGNLNYDKMQSMLALDDFKFYELLRRLDKDDIYQSFNRLPEQQDELDSAIEKESIDEIVEQIDELGESQKKVLMLYYFDHKPMKEIATKLNLSESRISQIHKQALTLIKNEIKSVA
ncbi:MAG: hypothetical protein COW00_01765 [Bdellovibrio sp. CG12_big_fil_rev_8_21_14_0_65_39_13]|nr:MAG: hypothetical protein COW78_03515 [Bdellovibrio sp. CG22_combo_CG10-13_8_21_14_all_39_27]PIQ62437.1 MAG: hypothetical protein COW00_01765 [Bdellovibrio sp. CG12_big_fil_rev_8_21_14_0_65_39_13]PIR34104.1 MAG: hypothetical protein COV37_14245 [Bdellovibrio sp. CG11_big_fil_rev_8_21_14_0_20_39_38]PJB53888.1 MAG: hypothetical protein CO099_04645 [Bdellovibrio sp. CG_4_9_14_3_um_filter_39_7]